MPLFPTSLLVSPKFSHVPLDVGGWPFGYEERMCYRLIIRAISIQDFQPTDGQTDRRTDDMQSQYRALH